jgi:hypothetical protein
MPTFKLALIVALLATAHSQDDAEIDKVVRF